MDRWEPCLLQYVAGGYNQETGTPFSGKDHSKGSGRSERLLLCEVCKRREPRTDHESIKRDRGKFYI